MTEPIITARDLTHAYGATPALRGVTLDVHPGEMLAVTGPSGCGKSTLLHCLSGLLGPDSGEVRYAGRPLGPMGERARSRLRRTDFGVLFQFGELIAELPAVDNVAFPLLAGGTGRREAHAAALDRLERLGVADVAGSRPGALSGGQRQRVALARALVTTPKVLFADEPTGALDSLTGERVLHHLVQLTRSGTTTILTTHDPKVSAYADRELPLHDGHPDPTGLGLTTPGTR